MLLKKIRNFSFKKMLAVVLAVCISLSLIQSTMFLSMAGTSEDQMLHLTPSSTNSKFGIYVPVDSVTAGEYVVQFKYKFTNGQLHDDYKVAESNPGAVFAVYNRLGNANSTNSDIKGLDWTPICWDWGGTNGTKTDLNANTVQYTFDITQKHIDDNRANPHSTTKRGFFIGFYTPKSADFYIADMVMYRSDDTDKTNILPSYLEPTNWRCGINQDKKYEGTLMSYDGDLIGDNQMLHLKPSADSAEKIGMKISKDLVPAGNYTVQFKYAFKKGALCYGINNASDPNYSAATDAAVFSVYSNQYKTGSDAQEKMQYVKCPGSGQDTYTYNNINSTTIEYNFEITSSDLTKCQDNFFIGFFVKGNPEFYIADIVMYKSDDADKTNILPTYPTASDWKYGQFQTFVDSNLPNGSEYVLYDESVFPKDKKILHLEGGGYQTGIKVDPAKVTVGNTYTVRFDYNFKQGAFKYDFETHVQSGWKNLSDVVTFNFFHDRKRDTYDRMFAIVRKSGSGKDGSTYAVNQIDNNTVEFTFKVIDEMTHTSANGSYYLGFWVSQGDIDLYVGNMVMYDTSDTTQTNILPDEIIDNWAYMNIGTAGLGGDGYDTVQSGVSSNGELLPYDEELLIPEDKGKQMLHFEGGAYQTGIKVDPAKITVGNTYKVRLSFNAKKGGFKYDFETHLQSGWKDLSDVVTFNFFHDRKRDTYARMFAIVRKAGTGTNGSTYKVEQIDVSTLEFTFKVNDEMSYTGAGGSYYLGFWFSRGDIDLYIADMVMYDASDTTQTNILPEIFETNWVYMPLEDNGYGGGSTVPGYASPKSGLAADSEIIPYDESLFPKTPIPKTEKMLRVTSYQYESFLAVAVEEGTIKPSVDYTISFKYHFENRDLDDKITCAVFYYDKNKQNGNTITSVAKITNNKPGMVLDTDFSKKYKDGAYAEYTFNLDAAMLGIYNNKLFVGFNVASTEEDHVLAYIYDFKLYETDDNNKTNLLKLDTYSDDLDAWVGNWGVHNMEKIRRYVDYDAALFVPTSEENLYVDYTFKGDDGEWWKPEDVASDSSEKTEVETATVKGRVIDQNGNPIADAKLVLKGVNNMFTAKTDANGYYSFNNVPVDLYELYIIDGQNREIFTGFSNFFANGDTATVNITCDSSKAVYNNAQVITGSLKGNVYTPDLKTVGNIKLYLRKFGEVTTNADGYFEFTDVPAGDYELYTILEDGSEYVFRTVEIKENVELSVKLKYDVPAEESNNNGWLIWVIVAAGVVLVLGGGTALLIILKRKKQNN